MDEFEILQLRLEMLSNIVDKFVILEAKHTFTGLEKPAHLSDNLYRFEKYLTKMHVVVLDAPYFSRSDLYLAFFDKKTSGKLRQVCSRTLTSQNVPLGDSHWVREFFNKEYLLHALQGIPLDSRIVVSDVDEIWNPKKPPTSLPQNGIFVYKQRPFVYLMNNLSDESWRNWTGSVTATLGSFIRYGVNNSRTHHRLPRRVIRTGGWHFSFQGGPRLIESKLDSYGHQELNTPTNRELISKIQSEFQDIRGIRANFKKNERLLPPEALAMKSRLPDWFL
jgi:beta-1,4-mannosyl-glycoprotein beta-1,4-N-acetylglucosaminyltransferase